MKAFFKINFLVIYVLICLVACSKKDNEQNKITPLDKLTVNYNERAKIWKNGVATNLTDGSINSSANSVFVSGNDVYVAGYDDNGTNTVAKLWKNGIGTALTDGKNKARANSVYVNGNDVYVAGFETISNTTAAKLWKNGTAIPLTNAANDGVASSVFVINNDVYVAGSHSTGTPSLSFPIAALWKNGVDITLPNISSVAKSLYAVGNDVYVAGYEPYNSDVAAKIWKNGNALPITSAFERTAANAIFVVGTDIYIAGYQAKYTNEGLVRLASVWKNNQIANLTDGVNGDSYANSVYVSGNDVFVAGNEFSNSKKTVSGDLTTLTPGNYAAKVWKNGIPIALTDGTKRAGANSVFVSGNNVYVAGYESDK